MEKCWWCGAKDSGYHHDGIKVSWRCSICNTNLDARPEAREKALAVKDSMRRREIASVFKG